METQPTEKNQQAVRSEQKYRDLIEELSDLIGDGLGNLALVARVLSDDQFYSQVCTLKAEDQGDTLSAELLALRDLAVNAKDDIVKAQALLLGFA